MRDIKDHILPGDPDGAKFSVVAVDAPGHGGASHTYVIGHADRPATLDEALIEFQDGPIKEVGVNGITDAQLLAVLIDRLRGFQKGPFACRENALALTKLEEALHWTHQRTIDRLRRGVEGETKA